VRGSISWGNYLTPSLAASAPASRPTRSSLAGGIQTSDGGDGGAARGTATDGEHAVGRRYAGHGSVASGRGRGRLVLGLGGSLPRHRSSHPTTRFPFPRRLRGQPQAPATAMPRRAATYKTLDGGTLEAGDPVTFSYAPDGGRRGTSERSGVLKRENGGE